MERIKRHKFRNGTKVLVELMVISLENWMDGGAMQQDKIYRIGRSVLEVFAWEES